MEDNNNPATHMKSLYLQRWLLLFCCFFLCANAYSQKTKEDSLAYVSAINNAKSIYHQALYPEEGLYTGSEYYGYPYHFQSGQPYYYNDTQDTGWIKYEGILYKNIAMRYDLIKDQLIVTQPKNNARICVINDRVQSFNLFNTTFVYIKTDSSKSHVAPGFYALLYDHDGHMLLKRNRKSVQEELSTTEGILRYINDDNFFIIKRGNTYSYVSDKKGFLKLYADKKKQLQQYIHKNGLDFKHDKDNAFAKSLAYYDSL
jgi:hypothetical protein